MAKKKKERAAKNLACPCEAQGEYFKHYKKVGIGIRSLA
jgi:hypothetical protein